MGKSATLREVIDQARELSPREKRQLIEEVGREAGGRSAVDRRSPRSSLWGLWADLKPAPTDDQIAAARAEAWREFPGRDI